MTITRFNLSIGVLLAVALIAILTGSFGVFVKANPSLFFRNNTVTCGGKTASTTVNYLTPGTGTTTYTVDMGCGGNQGADGAVLALQLMGSTSPFANLNYATTTYNVAIEYSQDGIDWYKDSTDAGIISTTTVSVDASQTNIHVINLGATQMDATILGGTVLATTSPTTRIFIVPTPTRYARAVIWLPQKTFSTNGSVWGEFIAKRQAN